MSTSGEEDSHASPVLQWVTHAWRATRRAICCLWIHASDEGTEAMKTRMLINVGMAVSLAVLAIGAALAAQDKYTLQVPNGLAFAEFKGYEDWPVIAISQNGGLIAVILGNLVMIDAYKAGVPGNAGEEDLALLGDDAAGDGSVVLVD